VAATGRPRGRPRKNPLPTEPNPVPPEQIGKDLEVLLQDHFTEQEQRELIDAEFRRDVARQVAQNRYKMAASGAHRLPNNDPLDFEDYPFQKGIYLDDAPEMVVMGSTQWGKSVFMVCTAATMACMDLRVFFVTPKFEHRARFLKEAVDPVLISSPIYRKKMASGAVAAAGKASDSVIFKRFGKGYINFVGSNSPGDFYGHSADVAIIDEHQLCRLDNLALVDRRMNSSRLKFKIIAGNPKEFGSENNLNLHWQYMQSDRRQWHIPCPHCGEAQVLGWTSHVIREERNKAGAIVAVEPLDKQWDPKSDLDMRAICVDCKEPMDRLSRTGFWKPTNEGHPRHGYQLSNLYNPRSLLRSMFNSYLNARRSPSLQTEFYNNEMGEPYSAGGNSLTLDMLKAAAAGTHSMLPVYQFKPWNMLPFKAVAA
jgi:phage terminase large subunit GpA-like protein